MDNVLMVALAKHFSKQTKEIRLAPGAYPIDETLVLKVQGIVNRSEDTEYTPTVEIPLLSTMALFLQKMGFQREKCKKLLIEAMTEALKEETQSSGVVAERVKDIESAMEHVRAITGVLPKQPRQGPTNVKITLTQPEPVGV